MALSSAVEFTVQLSPNFTTANRSLSGIRALLIHWWDTPSAGATHGGVVSWFMNRTSQVSAHYVCSANRVTQQVREKDIAWHAGFANRDSIGLELSPYCTDDDYQTAAELIASIWERAGREIPLEPHRQHTQTQCPGNWDLARLRRTARTVPSGGSAPATGGSGSSGGSSKSGVTGRFLRVTAQNQANLRSGPSESHTVIGTADRGALLRRNPSRDTSHWYGVGDRWFVGKSAASPVRAEASSVLVIGDWPGRRMPENGTNTFELNMAWRELLARTGIDNGTRTAMLQRWLRDRGYNPGPLDGKEGTQTISALQRYLTANGHQPGAVDGKRGPATRAAEKRFLNSQIQYLVSKYPQAYRHSD
jgi:hypothetical protein